MPASDRNAATSFLERAGLLAGILTVLAGILGMHVMTGSHSMHSAAAITAAAGAATVHTGTAAADGHPVHGTADTASSRRTGVEIAASSSVQECSCSDGCTSMQTMTVTCTPLAKTGSLSVPLPGAGIFGSISNARAPGAVPLAYSYLPGSPSPGQLSISRT
ncbi:hypothetical protein [Pseudarthrobacter sp. MM222]|uniref:hypothetical protein n=1 Tax=Pseudarthrobacter sp. MM222 TaxID=3018929 RepID=UPI002220EBD2|nr:hypothetical protein [Pseudarthrobacter sp. MM222]CAI3796873.1 hypothetical protein NKCBBBOE_01686 [Pseudarthrobacter sp. MM222]